MLHRDDLAAQMVKQEVSRREESGRVSKVTSAAEKWSEIQGQASDTSIEGSTKKSICNSQRLGDAFKVATVRGQGKISKNLTDGVKDAVARYSVCVEQGLKELQRGPKFRRLPMWLCSCYASAKGLSGFEKRIGGKEFPTASAGPSSRVMLPRLVLLNLPTKFTWKGKIQCANASPGVLSGHSLESRSRGSTIIVWALPLNDALGARTRRTRSCAHPPLRNLLLLVTHAPPKIALTFALATRCSDSQRHGRVTADPGFLHPQSPRPARKWRVTADLSCLSSHICGSERLLDFVPLSAEARTPPSLRLLSALSEIRQHRVSHSIDLLVAHRLKISVWPHPDDVANEEVVRRCTLPSRPGREETCDVDIGMQSLLRLMCITCVCRPRLPRAWWWRAAGEEVVKKRRGRRGTAASMQRACGGGGVRGMGVLPYRESSSHGMREKADVLRGRCSTFGPVSRLRTCSAVEEAVGQRGCGREQGIPAAHRLLFRRCSRDARMVVVLDVVSPCCLASAFFRLGPFSFADTRCCSLLQARNAGFAGAVAAGGHASSTRIHLHISPLDLPHSPCNGILEPPALDPSIAKPLAECGDSVHCGNCISIHAVNLKGRSMQRDSWTKAEILRRRVRVSVSALRAGQPLSPAVHHGGAVRVRDDAARNRRRRHEREYGKKSRSMGTATLRLRSSASAAEVKESTSPLASGSHPPPASQQTLLSNSRQNLRLASCVWRALLRVTESSRRALLTSTSMMNLWTRDRSRRLASPADILPVELWEVIFRHIKCDPELLCLARVCSTFNAVSIRLLLARHGQGQDIFGRTDLQLSASTLPGLYLSLRAFRDIVASVVHRTTGPVFIFLADDIFSCWPHDVDTWDLQQSLFMSPNPRTKTGAWVKRIRERFGRKPTELTTGKIMLHTGDIVDVKKFYSLRAVSIQLVEGNQDPPCAILILNPGKVATICGANIPAVDLGGALVHIALPSLRRVIIRTDKVNPTALRTFLANHPLISEITYDVSGGVLTSTHKLIDPPLAHPGMLALFRGATNTLGSARLLCGLQDSPNLNEFGFSFHGTLTPEWLALFLEDLRLVAVRTCDTKLTLCVWEQYPQFWASEEAREVARAMHAVHVCLVRTSTIWDARKMFPWLAQLPSAAEIQFEIPEEWPDIDNFPPDFNPQAGIPEFLEEARAALVGVRDITACYDYP
ncbi:hypothetical protein K438DRAFT_2082729 [Mycena galopus ATCC 62051]|nr:hypothetical protein K438DRAFT_2082729 [Mycena galopus ATCC 62051]